jgi:alpha-L-rhamnosidase
MNSQNHVMLLGDLLVWMYENLGGIQSDSNEVAFKRIIMKPSFDVNLSYATASYQSPQGTIKSSWNKENGELKWEISIPANSTSLVYIPAKSEAEVKEGNQLASKSDCVRFIKMENGKAVFEIGSGQYSFSVNTNQ